MHCLDVTVDIRLVTHASSELDMPFPETDTDPETIKRLVEGYRRMTPQAKMRAVSDMTRAVQYMALARIRKQRGATTERELRLRLASLWLDRKTMIRVFDWDPEREGY
jgi:Ser/Thr protein kinase RdoA (MazF antagonist)